MVTINIETFGESVVSRTLLRFQERLVDATPAFEAIAQEFYESEKMQFDTEGGWASGGWVPDKPATVQAKERAGLDLRTLHATLALRDSLTGDGAGAVREIRPDEMFLGSDIPYGIFHQQPTRRSDWLPMRKPVELPEDVRIAMVKTMQRFLVSGAL